MRIEKRKTEQLFGLLAHDFRDRPPANADPANAKQNVYNGTSESVRAALDDAAALHRVTTGRKPRKDAVRALEAVLTFSPGARPRNGKAWVQANLRFLEEEFGAGNVVGWSLHLDESTPHLHAWIKPMRDGKLQGHKMLGGPQELSALQDRYAAAMAPFDLSRGKKWSRARHKSVRWFYSRVEPLHRRFTELKRQLSSKTYEADYYRNRANELEQKQQPQQAQRTPEISPTDHQP